MNDIQQQVVTWHRATFRNATTAAIETKLLEECRELIDATCIGTSIDICDEGADVVIVLCALLDRYGVDIDSAVLGKLEINKRRVWALDSKGNWERVK